MKILNLEGRTLIEVPGRTLQNANLARANLAGAYLADANLAGADLAGADLARANLARANLARANLAGADLADANLVGAHGVIACDVPPPCGYRWVAVLREGEIWIAAGCCWQTVADREADVWARLTGVDLAVRLNALAYIRAQACALGWKEKS